MSTKLSKVESAERRKFLANTSTVTLFSTLAGSLNAKSSDVGVMSNMTQQNQPAALVFFSEDNVHCAEFATVFAAEGLPSIALGLDPVRQWRDGLAEASMSKPLIGLTTWSDYLMIRDLAKEQRRFPVLETEHHVARADTTDWASVHANELSQLIQGGAVIAEAVLPGFESAHANKLYAQSLFSWVIA